AAAEKKGIAVRTAATQVRGRKSMVRLLPSEFAAPRSAHRCGGGCALGRGPPEVHRGVSAPGAPALGARRQLGGVGGESGPGPPKAGGIFCGKGVGLPEGPKRDALRRRVRNPRAGSKRRDGVFVRPSGRREEAGDGRPRERPNGGGPRPR